MKLDRAETMRREMAAAVRAVPRGKVSSYGAIARAAGFPGYARQVVQMLHRSFGLPWHRIVGSGGEIKLCGDSALEQRLRLQAEGITFRGRHIDMRHHEHKFNTPRKNRRLRRSVPAKSRR